MADLYQVVDEQDNLIGYKLRHEIDFKNDYYRIGALWLTNPQGQILIAQRLLTKDKDPGKWGPSAAGTLEKDETYESNIYKEAEEEIGLTGVPLKPGPKMRFEEPRKAYCQWFLAECDWPAERFVPQPTEVEQVRWVDLETLKTDVWAHPEKYVPSMAMILNTLYG